MQWKSTPGRVVFSFLGAAILLAALAAILVSLDGCGPPAATSPAPPPPRPFDGITLKAACPGEPSRGVVERYGRGWATREGVRLEVAAYDPAAGPEAVAGADLWLIEPAALGRWAAADRLLPLPGEYTQDHPVGDVRPRYDWVGLLPPYRQRLLLWGKQAYALPVLGEAPVCFYRRDLFADPAHKAAFREKYGRDLAPPATWDDFADVAEFFAARPGTGPSLPPLGGDEETDREFYTIAASYAVRPAGAADLRADRDVIPELFSFHCDLATGLPRIASPGFVEALTMLKRLQPCRAAADGKPAPEAFAAGKAVLCLAEATWVPRFQKSPARPAFAVCRVPGSKVVFDYATGNKDAPAGGSYVPYLGAGGWLGVVPRGAAQAEAAFALLAELSGPEVSRQIVIEPEWGGGVFRRDQLSAAVGWSSFGLDHAQTTALLQALQQTLAHPGMGNPATRLRLPKEADYRKALLDEVRAALADKKAPADALKAADARWQALDPPERRRTEYALSLGLTPP
jgi:ABC-type glycerol-3-phosphate transport system substrate-binding protein